MDYVLFGDTVLVLMVVVLTVCNISTNRMATRLRKQLMDATEELSKSTKASLEFRAAHEQYVAASERYEAALVEQIDLLEADRGRAIEASTF